jgi:hypothetical protein
LSNVVCLANGALPQLLFKISTRRHQVKPIVGAIANVAQTGNCSVANWAMYEPKSETLLMSFAFVIVYCLSAKLYLVHH